MARAVCAGYRFPRVVDPYLAALEAAYPGKADEAEVIDFFGRDEALAHLCFACASGSPKTSP
jgi:hypothetical protein